MPPSSRSQQSSLAKGILAFFYHCRQDEKKSPLRPISALLRTRWIAHLYEWLPKQEDAFHELIEHGYYTVKQDIVFSTFQQATDCHLGNLPPARDGSNPAPMIYVRDPALQARYNAATGHVELTRATLPAGYQVSLPLITKASRSCRFLFCQISVQGV